MDYIIDSNSYKKLKGNNKKKISHNYKIVFEKKYRPGKGPKSIICPLCHADVGMISDGKCRHCGGDFLIDYHQFLLTDVYLIL